MASPPLKLEICTDLERLSQAAAELIALRACQAVAERGRFCLALSGGRTPRRTYQLLARPPLRDRLPWSQLHLFWGDERCVAAEDPRSNARMARKELLDHVPLPATQIHPITCTGDPIAAARAYEDLLGSTFPADGPSFDLVLLGLGEDGHTASLFPGTSALHEQLRLAVPVQVAGEPFSRITLTLPIINRARLILFMVSGENKAHILGQLLHGPPGHFPAQQIAPTSGGLLCLADRAAAAQIIEKQI